MIEALLRLTSGWPNAIAPPFTFTLSKEIPSFSTEYVAWEANASLISNKSMSCKLRPAFWARKRKTVNKETDGIAHTIILIELSALYQRKKNGRCMIIVIHSYCERCFVIILHGTTVNMMILQTWTNLLNGFRNGKSGTNTHDGRLNANSGKAPVKQRLGWKPDSGCYQKT